MMARKKLERLSQAELVELVRKQAAQIAKMQVELEQLKAENAALREQIEKGKKPERNSKNSSQAPSRDWKSNMPEGRAREKHGSPKRQAKCVRKMVSNPDHVVELKVACCEGCQTDLRGTAGELVAVNQVTELPEASAQVVEVRQYAVSCPQCGEQQVAQPPAGLEMGRRFGVRLEATVVYYRQEQHMSYERTQATLREVHGVHISQGGIDRIMRRAGRKAQATVERIQEQVCKSAVIYSDETGSRVNGQNWWQWVFCSTSAVLHLLHPTRKKAVIQAVMGQHQAEVWVSDCLAGQMQAPAKQHQICLAHQLRDLQAVIDRYPRSFWARAMQALLRASIHLHHQRPQLTAAHFQAQLDRLERLCTWLLSRSPPNLAVPSLQLRYSKYRKSLFVFLYRTDVSPTNNVSERALRPAVVHRKVSGGFRSAWGAKTYAALASLIDTAELTGTHAFQALVNLFGCPALPIPLACE